MQTVRKYARKKQTDKLFCPSVCFCYLFKAMPHLKLFLLALPHSASYHRLVLQLGLEIVECFTEISNLRNSRKPLILSGFSAVFVLIAFEIFKCIFGCHISKKSAKCIIFTPSTFSDARSSSVKGHHALFERFSLIVLSIFHVYYPVSFHKRGCLLLPELRYNTMRSCPHCHSMPSYHQSNRPLFRAVCQVHDL